MRDYAVELEKRVAFIQGVLSKSGAKGIVFGNSGGKDSALVGILCKKACDNTVGIMMPCESKRNFGIDMDDGGEVAKQFGIENRTVDITETKQTLVKALSQVTELNQQALTNINPVSYTHLDVYKRQVELELVSGEAAPMLAFAAYLQEHHALREERKSKFVRASELAE